MQEQNKRKLIAVKEKNGWRPTSYLKHFTTFVTDKHDVRKVTLDYYDGKYNLNASHPWKTMTSF